MKLEILLVEKVVQIVPESPKAYILREMTSEILNTSGATYDFYSYLSNKRSPTIILFGKIFQALRSY